MPTVTKTKKKFPLTPRDILNAYDSLENHFRFQLAAALNTPTRSIGCFTVCSHQNQPLSIIIHGGPHKGHYVTAHFSLLKLIPSVTCRKEKQRIHVRSERCGVPPKVPPAGVVVVAAPGL